jgi:hypothetical protein
MSNLISESLLLNNSWPKFFANWVFPTPVCPRKINEPIGLLGSFKPVWFLWIALTNTLIASSWPIILSFRFFSKSKLMDFSLVVLSIFLSGIPEISDTTSVILSSLTISLFFFKSLSHSSCWSINFFSIFFHHL